MLRSSIHVTLITIFGSVLGFTVQLLLAKYFGLGADIETYLFALSLPTFLAGVLSAMLSFTLVPRLVKYELDPSHQRSYIGSLMIGIGLFSIAVACLGWIAAGWQKHLLPADSPILAHPQLKTIIVVGWLIGASQIFFGYVAATLNALRKHKTAAATGLLPYLAMLVALLSDDDPSIVLVPVGMLMGTVASIMLGVFILRKRIFPLPWRNIHWVELRELAGNSPFSAVAMTMFSSYSVVDAYWAPRAGDGALAALGYAQRLLIALGNLAIAGPSAVVVPRFAAMVRDNKYQEFRNFTWRMLLFVGALSVILAGTLAFFSKDLIGLLFMRGEFGEEEADLVSGAMENMLPGMVMMLVCVIGMRALFCLSNSAKLAAAIGVTWTASYFGISCFQHQNGAAGIAAGYSVAWAITLFAILRTIVKLSVDRK